MTATTTNVLIEVGRERVLQDENWGEQTHAPVEWMSLLTEEVGEAAQEANKACWAKNLVEQQAHLVRYRAELLQVAAVAVSMVECLDRGRKADD